jgi:putative tricarboxylic transport membrane protein
MRAAQLVFAPNLLGIVMTASSYGDIGQVSSGPITIPECIGEDAVTIKMGIICSPLLLILLILSVPGVAEPAWKPKGNIEFVVGAGPGGENDRIARAIQRALGKEGFVESMTVLNRPGAGQVIAMGYLAKKVGDPNTIGLASGSFINAIARTGSTLHTQFTPLIKLFDAYNGYFASANSPIRSMVDVRDRLKENPRGVSFGIPVGLGSPLHVSVANLAKSVGAMPSNVVAVIYNSGSDVSAQVAGGHVDVGVTSLGSVMPLVQAGKLRMLGITAPGRQAGELAQYPTLREQGMDIVAANPYTVLVPNGLTRAQIDFWMKALDTVLLDDDFKLDLVRNFWTLDPIRHPKTIKWMQDDYDENRAVLKELGLLL